MVHSIAKMECPVCKGQGSWWEDYVPGEFGGYCGEDISCKYCKGTGEVSRVKVWWDRLMNWFWNSQLGDQITTILYILKTRISWRIP
jgi:hypothetical protein